MTRQSNITKHTQRVPTAVDGRGFTLIEVILVLVLLVVIGAITMPILTGTFGRSQLRNGGNVMRATWTQARLNAMEAGQPFIFRCQMKGAEFQVLSLADFAGGKATAPSEAEEEMNDNWQLSKKRLPSGVTFAAGDFEPSQQIAAQLGAAEGGGWSTPLVFQPDGTSGDASLLMANENKKTIRVTLRGLTGAIRVSEVGAEEFAE